jgi:hypothetical protein
VFFVLEREKERNEKNHLLKMRFYGALCIGKECVIFHSFSIAFQRQEKFFFSPKKKEMRKRIEGKREKFSDKLFFFFSIAKKR